MEPVGLEEATRIAVRTLEQQLGEQATLTRPQPAELDGAPARRFMGTGEGRTVSLLIAVYRGKTWTLTLTTPGEHAPAVLERAAASWRWD